jgi:uncharacterized protein
MSAPLPPTIRFVNWWLHRYRTAPLQQPTTTPAVLITGGSDGIGLALALAFDRDPEQPARRLILVARDDDTLARAGEIIQRQRGTVSYILALDITRADTLSVIEHLLVTQGLHVDVLVNNAGMGLAGTFSEADPAVIDRLLALNIAALTRLTRHFLNIASLGGLTPGPYQAAYYASKAYVISLTRAIRAEYAGQGVRIAVVAPGPVETQFHAKMGAEYAYYRRLIPAPSAEFIARVAYRGFRWGRTTIIPGWSWSMLAAAMTYTPLAVSVPIVRWLLTPRN